MRCIFCGIELKERTGKIYLSDKLGNTVMIEDHRYVCPRCGWWTDGKWEVYESTTQQKALDTFEGKEGVDASEENKI